jgi:hypothetical protein
MVLDFFQLEKIMRSIALILIGLLLAIAGPLAFHATALTVGSARDCDSNTVIECGALTPNELKQKYNNNAGVSGIFSHFGISSQDINNVSTTTAVEGKVTEGGRVVVDNKTVATDAITAGRQNMPGSKAITRGSITFYERPPSVSFASSSLPAFVVMKDGQFDFAIIASCGNPVKATPVKPPAKKPVTPPPAATAPTPTPTPPAPSAAATSNSSAVATAVVTPQVVAAPQPTPAPTPTPPPTPQKLPNTGPTGVLKLAGLATLAGTLSHLAYSYRGFGKRNGL